MTTREQIVAEARSWLGTRWHHQASVKGVGCDCAGLVIGVARSLGIEGIEEYEGSSEMHGYGRQPTADTLRKACAQFFLPVPPRPLLAGNILLMRFSNEPQHFALLAGGDPPHIIHAYAQARMTVEHALDALWLSRVVAAYSYKGVV